MALTNWLTARTVSAYEFTTRQSNTMVRMLPACAKPPGRLVCTHSTNGKTNNWQGRAKRPHEVSKSVGKESRQVLQNYFWPPRIKNGLGFTSSVRSHSSNGNYHRLFCEESPRPWSCILVKMKLDYPVKVDDLSRNKLLVSRNEKPSRRPSNWQKASWDKRLFQRR